MAQEVYKKFDNGHLMIDMGKSNLVSKLIRKYKEGKVNVDKFHELMTSPKYTYLFYNGEKKK